MEGYVVSARKYRPSSFGAVVGQHALTTTLKNAIATGKLAHAYLFCGPRGVGKTTCARIFAKTINCLNPKENGEACNECESCAAFNEQRSLNIHELDAASNNSVDDIRQLVEQVRIPPQIGRYKVYIIDEVHMLSSAAFNAFLKTLEEPPHYAIFILATTEKHKILPTILSRCQTYDFSRMTVADMVGHLTYVAEQEGISVEPEALNVIALKADGGMRDALSIFDQMVSFTGGNITYESVIENLNVLDYEYYFRLTDFFLENRVDDALLLLNDVLNHGFDGGHFVSGLASHLRDLLVSKDEQTLPLLEVGASIREHYREQAARCPLPFLYSALQVANECELAYRTSRNKRLQTEITLIRLAQLTTSAQPAPAVATPLKPMTQASAPASKPAPAAPASQALKATTPVSRPAPAPAKPAPAAQPRPAAPRSSVRPGFSIKQATQPNKPAAPKPAADVAPANNQADKPIDEDDVNRCWMEFANNLPREHTAMAKRMKGMTLKLQADNSFEVVVDNPIAEREFSNLVPEVQDYMRRKLQNQSIAMHVRVSEASEPTRAYSRGERYQMMLEKNESLQQLSEAFGLELY